MQWYDIIFEVIEMRSFSNLWFWIALAVMWSSASHWVLGVPFDMVTRAHRHGGQAATDLHDMVRINVGRIMYIVRVSGLWLVGFVFFTLTILIVLSAFYRSQLSQAVLCLLAPMTLVGLLNLRTAAQLEQNLPEGEALYRRMVRQRVMVQAIGMVSIFFTALWGMLHNLSRLM